MKDFRQIKWPIFVTVRFTKSMCGWMAQRLKHPEGPAASKVRQVYAQFYTDAKLSCQFTFCDDESYVGSYSWSHLLPLSDARELRHAVKRALEVKVLPSGQRVALENRLKKLDDVLHTSPVDRLAAIV